MPLWDALSHAMGTSRMRRIGSREAEQLLTADPDGSAYPDLSHLLAAAAAPPRPDELVGLRAAVAAFEATGQDDGDLGVAASKRRRVFVRSIAVKAVAGMAVVLFGGTALAAETGNLPGGSQQHAHDLFSALGVPPPDAGPTPTGPPVERTTPTPAPSSGNHGATPDATSAATLGLCRSWDARQKNPKNKPMKAESLRVLAAAAGGEEHIAAFCTALLADDDKGKTATDDPSTVPATPGHPGNGKGHDKTTPTPNPHKKG